MLCFLLPKWVIARIDKARRSFLWGNRGSRRRVSLCNWELVCSPKKIGGLGLPDLHLRNISLILRWWWKAYSDHSSMWTALIVSIRVQGIRSQGPLIWSKRGSFFWIQLITVEPQFNWSTAWSVGNGLSISYWFDNWGEEPMARLGSRRRNAALSLGHANQLLTVSGIQFSSEEDVLRWRWSSNGIYSAQSWYKMFITGGRETWPFRCTWKYKAPPTVRIFVHLLLQGKTLTKEVMLARNFNCYPDCILCTAGRLETALHLFFCCPFARQVWHLISIHLGFTAVLVRDSVQETCEVSSGAIHDTLRHRRWETFFSCTCWGIWKERNL